MASNSPDYFLCIIICNTDPGLIHHAYLCSGHDLCNTHTTGHRLHNESILYLSVVMMRQTATGDLADQQRKLGRLLSALCVMAADAHHGAAGTVNMSCAESPHIIWAASRFLACLSAVSWSAALSCRPREYARGTGTAFPIWRCLLCTLP